MALSFSVATSTLSCYLNSVPRHPPHDIAWSREAKPECDFATRDGHFVAEVKHRLRGHRELAATMFRMARLLEEAPGIQRAYLVLLNPRMSARRQAEEWGAGLEILKSSLAGKMALVRLDSAGTDVVPKDPEVRRVIEALLPQLTRTPATTSQRRSLGPPRSFFDVLKILVHSWLFHEGALAIRELKQRCELSYPSVAEAVRRLEDRGEARRETNRSVELIDFPRTSWAELLSSADAYRMTARFADASGRAPEPDFLHQLLSQRPIPGVAVGGVLAARSWDPDFDLVGLPRLDLELGRGVNSKPEDVAKSLDPALVPAGPSDTVALVIHVVLRPKDLLVTRKGERLPFADPVETLLDLYDLRLVDQAEALIRRLRTGGRDAFPRP